MQLLRKRDLHAQQLQKAIFEKSVIQKIEKSQKSTKIAFGSVIITSMQKLFVSIGLGKIGIDNDQYFAISVNSPIFKQLKNKTKGDSFHINNKEVKILEVF
jgi:transcription elongation GreA/GreB family factor